MRYGNTCVRGSLWVLPGLSVLAALAVGAVLSSVRVGARSPLAFQGTPDDARTLLLGITRTMITIIALLLGLAVVALQLSSTQFSPRLLRNFLRDRPNQVVLSAFVATFAYSAAGLYTVGVSGGDRTAAFPRLAVSGAIVLLFVSLGLLVSLADHLLHSIQVDAIMDTVQRNTLAVIEDELLTGGQEAPGSPAVWAVPVVSRRLGVRAGGTAPDAAAVCSPARRQPASAAQGWRARRGRDNAGLDLAALARRSRSGSGGLHPGPGQRSPDRVRADAGAGRRVRDPAARRRGVQGAVPGGQRPVHRRPGRRPPVGDLLHARPAAAGRPRRPRRPGGRDRTRPGGSATTYR